MVIAVVTNLVLDLVNFQTITRCKINGKVGGKWRHLVLVLSLTAIRSVACGRFFWWQVRNDMGILQGYGDGIVGFPYPCESSMTAILHFKWT